MVALPMFGMGVALMLAVLSPFVAIMMPVAAGLVVLGVAAAIFGLAAELLGKGIQSMVEGINEWDVGASLAFAFSLIPFGIALMYAAIPFLFGALLIGVGALILGAGLQVMGKGIQMFTGAGMLETMLQLGVALFFFGLALMFASVPFLIGAVLIGLPALLLGIGLQSLAAGIEGFTKRGMFEAMSNLTKMLWVFGFMLMYASIPFLIGATLVGVGALLLGVGLQSMAKGIEKYNQGMMETMLQLSVALFFFGMGLMWAGPALLMGGVSLLIGALALTPALLWLWVGLQPWQGMDLEWLGGLGNAILAFAIPLFFAGLLLMFAGIPFLIGAVTVGLGMAVLGWGLQPWFDGNIDHNELPMMAVNLALFAAGMYIAGVWMVYAGIPFLIGATLLGLGMWIINKPLAEFANTLAVLAPIAPQIPAIAKGLATLGEVLPGFGWGILKLGIAASMPFFKTGLKTLSRGLKMFAGAISGISEEKAIALGNLFVGLELFSSLSGVGKIMRELGWGIYWIANALHHMPEGVQAIQFSYAAEALAELAEASMGVTAEQVVNVQGLADAARDYAWSSRLMRKKDEDALVGALQELVGIAKAGKSSKDGKQGQDVVLEIDGKEFARAVDAAINSKHGMPF